MFHAPSGCAMEGLEDRLLLTVFETNGTPIAISVPSVKSGTANISLAKDANGDDVSSRTSTIFKFSAGAGTSLPIQLHASNPKNGATGFLFDLFRDDGPDTPGVFGDDDFPVVSAKQVNAGATINISPTPILTAATYFARLRATGSIAALGIGGQASAAIDFSATMGSFAKPAMVVNQARPAGPIDNGNSGVEFGNRILNGKAPTRTFRVFNTGNGPLNIGTLSLPAGFSLADPLVGPIAPGGGESFTVRMDTAIKGIKDGFISIANNDAGKNPFRFRVSGTVGIVNGPSPEITVNSIQKGQLRGVSSGLSTFNFGSAAHNAKRPARTFRVSNDGDASLILGKISISPGFVVLDGLPASIAPGQTDTLIVALDTTTAAGSKSGTISFSTNDANENPFSFKLTGTVS